MQSNKRSVCEQQRTIVWTKTDDVPECIDQLRADMWIVDKLLNCSKRIIFKGNPQISFNEF